MAGRAGRRGIDEQGHTVVVQTPFEGAEDCCKLLFAGSDPLVSQFTATYGMALNLLAVRTSLSLFVAFLQLLVCYYMPSCSGLISFTIIDLLPYSIITFLSTVGRAPFSTVAFKTQKSLK
jgi:hypothetical protein